MPKVALYNQSGSTIGDVELLDAVFGIEPNQHVMHEVALSQQASRRQGTHATKNRAAVRGGGRKPWRQKGTGRARHGTIRSPIWVGGGVVFGPTPRNYGYKLPQKVRRLALKSALSAKAEKERLKVVDNLQLDQPKTKEMIAILESLNTVGSTLIVLNDTDDQIGLSARNIPNVTVMTADRVSVLDILSHDGLIMTQAAVAKTEEVLG